MKRTPLSRTSRLEPGTPPARRTPLARNAPLQSVRSPQASREPEPKAKSAATGRGGMGQPKATPSGEFSAATRLLVRKRAGRGDEFEAECEACGKWLGKRRGQVQHRLARGSGGSGNPVIRSAANAALLCGTPESGCHGEAESRDAAKAMEEKGFCIPAGNGPGFDPRYVPILLHSARGEGSTFYLAADGKGPDGTGYLSQRPEAVAA